MTGHKIEKQIEATLSALRKRRGKLIRAGVPDGVFRVGQMRGLWVESTERGIPYCIAWDPMG